MTTTAAASTSPAPAAPAAPAAPLLSDPAKIREAATRKRAPTGRRRPGAKEEPAPVVAEVIPPEEQEFWARQVQSLCNSLAAARDYPKLPPEVAAGTGEAAALVARKWTPKLAERPEVLLLSLLGPWLLNVARIEGERLGRWLRERRAVAEGRPPGDSGTDGARKDGPNPNPGSPWTPALGTDPHS